jgi:hypothetical protein
VTTATPVARWLSARKTSFDSIQAYNPIQLLKQSLGLAIPGERFGGIFIGRGSRPSGVLMTPELVMGG